MSATSARQWDEEYRSKGIPSSSRDNPSGVLLWALANYPFLHDTNAPRSVLDAGCGTGRNSIFVQRVTGATVIGLDYSEHAIALARERDRENKVDFRVADLTTPLDVESDSCDLIADIFVYFHILTDTDRKMYRSELRRACKNDGVLLVSMATSEDEYYRSCPSHDEGQSIDIKWDPIANVGNILPTEAQLLQEFTDTFTVQMFWRKTKSGAMHGSNYLRSTTALLLKPRSVTSSS